MFDLSKLPLLEHNKGAKPFRTVQFLHEKSFTDTYYDNDERDYPLTTQDIWLRQRDLNWECKTPMNLTASMDSYHELIDLREIADFLGKVLGASKSPVPENAEQFKIWLKQQHGLTPFGTIQTTRRHYLIDDEFTLDLDKADFGHYVGELELVVHSKEQVHDAERKIAQYMKEHEWFFDTSGVVMGKLSAYIINYNNKQRECMEKSGVLTRKLFPKSLDDVTARK